MQNGVIVGCGAMGQCHAGAYGNMKNVKIIAVVDTNQEKGESLAGQLKCKWVCNLQELKQEKVDFVDICLPTFLHVSAIREAAELTDKIICEKPLAANKEEIEEVFALVQEKKLHLMVAQVLRFFDDYRKAYELVKEGALGKVNSISCTRRQKKPAWTTDNWFFNEKLSGGLVFDLMIHDLDYVVWMMGKPKAVMGDLTYAKDQSPMHAKVQLYYDDCTVDMVASWGMPGGFAEGGMRSSLEIVGDEAMLYCDNAGHFVFTDHEKSQELSQEQSDPYEEELRYFVDCCEQGVMPKKSSVDTVWDSLKVAFAVKQAIEEHRKILLMG